MASIKRTIGLLLIGAILGSFTTFGIFQFYKAKKSPVSKTIQNKPFIKREVFGKEVWDWLNLLAVGAVPVFLAVSGGVFGLYIKQRDKKEQQRLEQERNNKLIEVEQQRKERAKQIEKQEKLKREIANNNLAEEAIQAYFNQMSNLLLNKEFRKDLFPNVNDKLNPSSYDNPVRDVARTQTITILRRLKIDKELQARVIDFLRDAKLYQIIFQNANLSKIDLSQNNLFVANLQKADLQEANFQNACLLGANLQNAYLERANFQNACLLRADLQDAYLERANLQGADLNSANLQKANLERANLQGADLFMANLQETNLERTNLQGANLFMANLQEAILIGTENLTPEQIKSTCFWDRAIYKGKWDEEERTWVAIEPDNTEFIEELKNDIASNPDKLIIDYSRWKKEN